MKIPEFQPTWPESLRLSWKYDQLEFGGDKSSPGYSRFYQARWRHTLDLVESVAKPGVRILDVAAGQGNFSIELARRGYLVTWNDLRAELVEYVRAKQETGEIDFLPGNILEVEGLAPFDLVVATEVIEHVAHPDQFLANLSHLVRPGGHLILTTPNGGYCRNNLPKFSDCTDPAQFESGQFRPNADGHIFLLHPDEIPGLARGANLGVVKLEVFGNVLTNGHVKTAKLLGMMPLLLVDWGEQLSQQLPEGLKNKVHSGMAVLFRKC